MARPPRHAEFFRVWTPEMAYVLGYVVDGWLYAHQANTRRTRDSRSRSNDRDHLETIAQTIGGNYGLRKVSEDSQCYKITFCSKEMYQDILAHGGTPHKSRTIGFPYIPAGITAALRAWCCRWRWNTGVEWGSANYSSLLRLTAISKRPNRCL